MEFTTIERIREIGTVGSSGEYPAGPSRDALINAFNSGTLTSDEMHAAEIGIGRIDAYWGGWLRSQREMAKSTRPKY